MKRLRAFVVSVILAGSLAGCAVLEALGLKASAVVVCDKDGCRVEGHVHK